MTPNIGVIKLFGRNVLLEDYQAYELQTLRRTNDLIQRTGLLFL